MQLAIFERMVLLETLPQTGSILTLRIVADLRKELALSALEIEIVNPEELPDGRVRWDDTKDPMKDFVFDNPSLQLIRKALQTLDDKATLTLRHVPLWDKFFPENKPLREVKNEAIS